MDSEILVDQLVNTAKELKALLNNFSPTHVTDLRITSWLDRLCTSLDELDHHPGPNLGPDHSLPGNLRLRLKPFVRGLRSAQWLSDATQVRLRAFVEAPPVYCGMPKYKLSFDCFSSRVPQWEHDLEGFVAQPNLHFLEVGSFEGHSASWQLENVLTHPTADLTCVDFFPKSSRQLFECNVRGTGVRHKVTALAGNSQHILRFLARDHYDFIYIDASHDQVDVMEDAILCWALLKPKGLLTFDDYLIKESPVSQILFGGRPDIAVDAFLSVYEGLYDVVSRGYQVTIRKLKSKPLAI